MSERSDILRDEIALREASLRDARAEHAAGELTDDALDAVVARESAAIAKCQAELEELAALAQDRASGGASPQTEHAAAAGSRSRRHRRGFLFAAFGCFVVAVVVILVAALSPRQPGSSATGGITQSQQAQVSQLLADGEVDVATQSDGLALVAFNQVLSIEPNNVEALTQSGWLSFSAGSTDKRPALVMLGVARLRRAVEAAPRDPDPRLYYAIAAATTPGETSLARQQFRSFLSLRPNATLRALATPWLRRLGMRAS